MRLVTHRLNGRLVPGIVSDDVILSLPDGWPDSLLGIIEAGPTLLDRLQNTFPQWRNAATRTALRDADLAAPIPRPRKNIMCIGLNYREHARESAHVRGMPEKLPEHPVLFTKNVTSVNGPDGVIPAQPGVTSQLDWEVELGVVIGTGGRGIAREHALQHVFGYTIINDITARDLQFRHKQFFLGKSLDGCCPMGPVIVTRDEIPGPQNLHLRSWVNGVLKQDGQTRDMVFDIPAIISTLSQGMRLEPGDLIATGTPAGVGFARNPPEYLKPGDVVECEIELIGKLRNRVV